MEKMKEFDDTVEEIISKLQVIDEYIKKKQVGEIDELSIIPQGSKMNARPNFLISSKLHAELKKEAETKGVKMSELCRERLRDKPQLDRIEEMLREIKNKICV